MSSNQASLTVKVCAEIVSELVKAHEQGKTVNLNALKSRISAKHKSTTQPKLVDIIAAIPERYKEMLLPAIRAKPIRTASGIAVVAVMSKPHRCPHIAMTGNICVYCLSLEHQILTNHGFLFLKDMLKLANCVNSDLLVAGYDAVSKCIVYEKPKSIIIKESDDRDTGKMIEISAGKLQGSISALVTADHDMFIDWGKAEYEKVKSGSLLNTGAGNGKEFRLLCNAANGLCRTRNEVNSMCDLENLISCENILLFLDIYGYLAFKSWFVCEGGFQVPFDMFDDSSTQDWFLNKMERFGFSLKKSDSSFIFLLDDPLIMERIYELNSERKLGNWVLRLEKHLARYFLRALGPVSLGKSYEIRVNGMEIRDQLVQICLHAGYSSSFREFISQETILWIVSFSEEEKTCKPSLNTRENVKMAQTSGITWCVSVPSGMIITRRTNSIENCVSEASKPMIIGNCPGGPDSDFEYSTQSYTGYEPTSMRAIRARYNPYEQARSRIDQLKSLGHSVDKVEYILMGGTFMSLPEDYREWFVKNLHDALSGHQSTNIDEAVRYSEQSLTKCIGITIETRPDYCLKPHIGQMLRYGCTRLEIGVQSVFEDVARDTNRGHTVKSVCEAFHLSKDAGYKIVAHMMPDLPNVGMERDIEQFKEFFENPMFRADGLKIYPTLVIRGTGLYELWRTGRYKNYSPNDLVDLVARIMALVPPWTRVYRIQRDIPMPLVTSGVENGNLRELALQRMRDLGTDCRDVRTREVGIQDIHHKIRPDQVELIRRDYVANGGWETFISYEDPEQDILIGLLRLRKCSEAVFRPEMKGMQCSIVRELHVYGSVVPIHNRDPTKFQHQGYGTLLMEEAERISKFEHGSKKLLVIAGVGTRNYYRKLGYELEGPYMSKLI